MNTNIGIGLNGLLALLHLALAGLNANDPLILGTQLTAAAFWVALIKYEYL